MFLQNQDHFAIAKLNNIEVDPNWNVHHRLQDTRNLAVGQELNHGKYKGWFVARVVPDPVAKAVAPDPAGGAIEGKTKEMPEDKQMAVFKAGLMEQYDLVSEKISALKKENADRATMKVEVDKMLALKKEYTDQTGERFPQSRQKKAPPPAKKAQQPGSTFLCPCASVAAEPTGMGHGGNIKIYKLRCEKPTDTNVQHGSPRSLRQTKAKVGRSKWQRVRAAVKAGKLKKTKTKEQAAIN